MLTLYIEFDEAGGTLFQLKYKPVTSSDWNIEQITSSPVSIDVDEAVDYDYCITKICSTNNESVEICGIAKYTQPCLLPTFAFVSRNSNLFTFSYVLNSNQPQFDIEITPPSSAGNLYTKRYSAATNVSPFVIALDSLTIGIYRFRMRGVCGTNVNSGVSSWSSYIDVDVEVGSCESPSAIVESKYSSYGGSTGIGDIQPNITYLNVTDDVVNNDRKLSYEVILDKPVTEDTTYKIKVIFESGDEKIISGTINQYESIQSVSIDESDVVVESSYGAISSFCIYDIEDVTIPSNYSC